MENTFKTTLMTIGACCLGLYLGVKGHKDYLDTKNSMTQTLFVRQMNLQAEKQKLGHGNGVTLYYRMRHVDPSDGYQGMIWALQNYEQLQTQNNLPPENNEIDVNSVVKKVRNYVDKNKWGIVRYNLIGNDNQKFIDQHWENMVNEKENHDEL